jgi:hypothetical protein
VNIEKYLLNKIVGLARVPENPPTDISDEMSVAPEEQSK